MARQVLPRFGDAPLGSITNNEVRRWVSDLLDSGLSAATTRKTVFGFRQALEAAVADGRLLTNPAMKVPLPSERQDRAQYLSQQEVERLVSELPVRDQALALAGAHGGIRWR